MECKVCGRQMVIRNSRHGQIYVCTKSYVGNDHGRVKATAENIMEDFARDSIRVRSIVRIEPYMLYGDEWKRRLEEQITSLGWNISGEDEQLAAFAVGGIDNAEDFDDIWLGYPR